MLPDKDRMCHCTGFTKSCRELVTTGACQDRWVQIQGKNPNTGEPVNRWGCVDNWGPLLQLESTKAQRETGASVDRLRDEAARRGDAQRDAIANALVALPAAIEPAIPLTIRDQREH